MILYFSGTGNSAYIAKRVGKATGDEVVDLFEKIRNRDFSSIHTERPLVVVTPTYAWRLPRIVEDWMERTTFTGDRRVYFILTCGENIGNAGKYLEALCGKKGLKNCAAWGSSCRRTISPCLPRRPRRRRRDDRPGGAGHPAGDPPYPERDALSTA